MIWGIICIVLLLAAVAYFVYLYVKDMHPYNPKGVDDYFAPIHAEKKAKLKELSHKADVIIEAQKRAQKRKVIKAYIRKTPGA